MSPCEKFGCSACCHDIEMLLTDDDVGRIAHATGRRDFYEQADDGYLQLRTKDAPAAKGWNGGAGVPVPTTPPPKPCTFLDPDGRCSIHEARPEGCRLYPATWDGVVAELDRDYCPHPDDFVLSGQTSAAVRRLAERLEMEKRKRIL
jgi:hypothetical protein